MSSTNRGSTRITNDAYYTPDRLAQKLVGLLPITNRQHVVEPHAGGGAFVRALLPVANSVTAYDIDPAAPGLKLATYGFDGDFLTVPVGYMSDWIVGNPPFHGFEKHIDHALKLAPDVAFLLRLAAMESASRIDKWKTWPLRKVWVLAERPSFTGGTTDSCAYGFFWFDLRHRGAAEVVPGWSWK